MAFVNPFREVPFLLVTTASFLFFLGLFLPFTYLILEGPVYGMSSALAGYLIPILNATRSVIFNSPS